MFLRGKEGGGNPIGDLEPQKGGVLRVGGGVPHAKRVLFLGSPRGSPAASWLATGGGDFPEGFPDASPGVWPGGEGFFKGVKWGHLWNKGGSPWFGVNGVLVPLAGFHMLVPDRASV